MKNRKIILIILVVLALVMFATSMILMLKKEPNSPSISTPEDNDIYYIEADEGIIKTNNSESFRTEKEKDGLVFTDIRLVLNDGLTSFSATVENTSDVDKEEKIYHLVFLDKEEKPIEQVVLIVPALKAKEANVVLVETLLDVVNAYDFQIID